MTALLKRHTRLVLLLLILTAAPSLAGAQQLNILWLTCEDLSPRMGCYGDHTIPTPNIDRLAKEGVRFTNAFTSTGVCAPCRFSIITGLHPMQAGAQYMRTGSRSGAVREIKDPELRRLAMSRPLFEATPPAGVRCFTEYLRMQGYCCTNNSKQDYQFKTPVTAWDASGKKAHYRNRPSGRPFFAVFNSTVTHESKLHGKRKSPAVTDRAKVRVPSFLPDTPAVREDIARQYDNMAVLDAWVGKKLNELEDAGLADSTIVFFYSDHGDGLPRHKRWVYDSGTRIPLIVRFPDGRRAGELDDRLVSSVDLAPTAIALAGAPRPDYLPGRSLLSESDPRREHVFMHRDRMDDLSHETIRSARDARYRYVRNYRPGVPYLQPLPYRDRIATMGDIYRLRDAGRLNPSQWQWSAKAKPIEELYDTQADPDEVHNLASDPAHLDKLLELRAALEQWVTDIDDPLATPEAEVVRTRVWPPAGKQPTTAKPTVKTTAGDGKETLVSIECTTDGASIGYRTDKSGPWTIYTKPFTTDAERIEVVAHRIGWKLVRVVEQVR